MVPQENIFEDAAENMGEEELLHANDTECVVFRDNISNIVLVQCKHLKICDLCYAII